MREGGDYNTALALSRTAIQEENESLRTRVAELEELKGVGKPAKVVHGKTETAGKIFKTEKK